MVSETKIDDTFPESEFLIEDFSTLNRLDWTAMRREFCSTYDRIYYLNISKITMNESLDGFFCRAKFEK